MTVALINIINGFDTHHCSPHLPKIVLPRTKTHHMSVIIILLIASISVAALFLVAFIWSIRNGQMDDDYSPPRRILFDDTIQKPKS